MIDLQSDELALINEWSKKTLTAEEVYTFSVRLCDNEIDRDGERFAPETLRELAPLFLGKSGIFDHQWSAKGQTARIYRTEFVSEGGALTTAGDPSCYLKGYAYMLRSEQNGPLIGEIEGGIKREVSVGCAVSRTECSICHEDMNDRTKCKHTKGKTYNGNLCWAELKGAIDAYEWSFVAVPAQKKAGVMKKMKQTEDTASLEAEAELGRRYLAGLRSEVARLMGIAEPALGATLCKDVAQRLDEPELCAMKGVYERRASELLPAGHQLPYSTSKGLSASDNQFYGI